MSTPSPHPRLEWIDPHPVSVHGREGSHVVEIPGDLSMLIRTTLAPEDHFHALESVAWILHPNRLGASEGTRFVMERAVRDDGFLLQLAALRDVLAWDPGRFFAEMDPARGWADPLAARIAASMRGIP